jgi:hypothetical protein
VPSRPSRPLARLGRPAGGARAGGEDAAERDEGEEDRDEGEPGEPVRPAPTRVATTTAAPQTSAQRRSWRRVAEAQAPRQPLDLGAAAEAFGEAVDGLVFGAVAGHGSEGEEVEDEGGEEAREPDAGAQAHDPEDVGRDVDDAGGEEDLRGEQALAGVVVVQARTRTGTAKRTSAVTELSSARLVRPSMPSSVRCLVAGGEEIAHVEPGQHPRELEPEEEGHDRGRR